MHCWKILNLEHHYGTTRIIIMGVITFLLVFSVSYVTFNLFNEEHYTDRLFWLFVIAVLTLYPIHKFLHFVALFDLRQHLKLRVRSQFYIIPVLHMRIREPLSKNRYILALLTPFIVLNTSIIVGTWLLPAYTH